VRFSLGVETELSELRILFIQAAQARRGGCLWSRKYGELKLAATKDRASKMPTMRGIAQTRVSVLTKSTRARKAGLRLKQNPQHRAAENGGLRTRRPCLRRWWEIEVRMSRSQEVRK
jgi:hypothetical protein